MEAERAGYVPGPQCIKIFPISVPIDFISD